MTRIIATALLALGTNPIQLALTGADAADCDKMAKKVFALTLDEVKNDPQVQAIDSKAEKKKVIAIAQAEIKKQEKTFVADAIKQCLADVKEKSMTKATVACVMAATNLDAVEKCE